MSLVTAIISYNDLHDLWGAGFTIVRRNSDPFEIDPKLIPKGMSYQWNPIKGDGPDVVQPEGWNPVPYSRHEGVFAPWGTTGSITRDGLALGEKPQVVVDLHRGAARAAAAKLIDDWATKTGAAGLSGSVTVATQTVEGKLDTIERRDVGDVEAIQIGATKTIETIVAIPREMIPHMGAIFAERDRLEAEVVRKDRTLAPGAIADKFYAAIDADKAAPWWPTLRAIILPVAIENVRLALRAGQPNSDVNVHPDRKDSTDE